MTMIDDATDASASPVVVPYVAKRRWGRFVLPTYSWLVIAYLVFPIATLP